METNSNAEKQARYRKKERLKRKGDQLIRKWQLEPWKHHQKSLQEINQLVEAATRLPTGWTDEDFLKAEVKLNQVYSEIVSPVNQLSNDVHETRNVSEEFLKSPDPSKFSADLKRAEEETNALAAHLISALNLSRCNDADKAAAVMEAVRFIGRSLAMNDEVPCSQATTICLATINFSYERPEWFSKKFAKTLAQRVQPKEVSEIVGHLNPNRNL